jgi:tRNA threonylcarbamoyladenosine biosynthesis protein TsaB
MNLKKGQWLILDTAMPEWFAGLLEKGKVLYWENHSEPVLEGFLGCLDRIFPKGTGFFPLDGIVFCEGPGSHLGIRTVCLFLRTLRILPAYESLPIYTYNALHLAQLLQKERHISCPYRLVARAGWDQVYQLNVEDETRFSTIGETPFASFDGGAQDVYGLSFGPKNSWPHRVDYRPTAETFFGAPMALFRPIETPDVFRLP